MSLGLQLALLSLLALSCGKQTTLSPRQDQSTELLGQEIGGSYVAFLRPLNSNLNGFIPFGRVEIEITAGFFRVRSFLDDDQPVVHRQNIHFGTKCPTGYHDQNQDGFIDAPEAYAALGKILIPLDGDLRSQELGSDWYPVGPSFTYEREAELPVFLNDLHAPNLSSPIYGKLENKPLKLEGRAVLIHGTAATDKVKSTIRSIDQIPPHLSVPIACGVLQRTRK